MKASTSFWEIKGNELSRRRAKVLLEQKLNPEDKSLEIKLQILNDEIAYCAKNLDLAAYSVFHEKIDPRQL